MSNFWQQLVSIWSRLDVPQRATIVLVALAGIAVAIALAVASTQPDYRLLAAGLPKSQVSEIAAYLEANHIPYELADRESAILIPSQHLHKVRNDLAQQEMLGDGSKGFEILGKTGMFESVFSEHKTYDRAVAGELERSFKELPGVRSARVIIDRPQPSPFVGDESALPRASIKLDMAPGSRLTDRQTAGVVHLTAGAISGLAPDRVQVMDNAGLLTRNGPDGGAGQASTALEAEIARENHLTRKAQEQLDAILGPGRSQVKVSVKLDFTKRQETLADPTVKVASRERTQTSDEKTPVIQSGGKAGTASNVEGEARPEQPAPQLASKTMEDTSTDYVVGKKTVTTEDELGRLRGMNVSILLDYLEVEAEEKGADGKPTGAKVKEYREYTAEERKRFEELVLNAIGFNAAKDMASRQEGADLKERFTSSVQSMRLWRPEEPVAAAGIMALDPNRLGEWIGWALAGLVAVGLLVVARGQLSRSHRAWADAEARARAATEEEQRRNAPPPPEPGEEPSDEDEMNKAIKKRRENLRDSIKKRILEDPAGAAQIVKQWIYE
jgi:flagellar M-ring protein FliF